MRAIAHQAGVSTGNAYYYFGSKEELIQEFYARNTAEHAAAARPVLDTETAFAARLRGTLRALIDVMSPYHEFAAKYFKHAAEPTNPLSPFSSESSAARDASIGLYREVVEGSAVRIDPACAPGCPSCCGCTRWASCCTGCTTPRPAVPAPISSSTARCRSRTGSSGCRGCPCSAPPCTDIVLARGRPAPLAAATCGLLWRHA